MTHSNEEQRLREIQDKANATMPKLDVPTVASAITPKMLNRYRTCSTEEAPRKLRRSPQELEVERLQWQRDDLLKDAGVPQRHVKVAKTRTLVGPPQWFEADSSVQKQLGQGFLIGLIGPRGTGKTQIAVNAVYASCYELRSCLYANVIDFFMELRQTYRKDSPEPETGVLRKYEEPRLLVLDELGERGDTDWEDRVLTRLLDRRYGEGTDTLLVANLSPDEFSESVGSSVSDRLRETGGIIECAWGSFRDGSVSP